MQSCLTPFIRILGLFCVTGLVACAQAGSGSDGEPDLRHGKVDMVVTVKSPDLKTDGSSPDLTSSNPNGDMIASDNDLSPGTDCGDGLCQGGETCTTCPADCGACGTCPAGFGDCDPLIAGCETNLNTIMNCGGCGIVCQNVGGTNACMMDAASGNYKCVPTCLSGHADCDGIGANGCEADTQSPAACGACGKTCANPHGTTVCTTTGADFFCAPTCTPGFGACDDPSLGCDDDIGTDPNRCGGCSRSCAATNTLTRSCDTGVCKPTCAKGFADCNHPTGSSPDDGCELDGSHDHGENDNQCPGQAFSVGEGSTNSTAASRLLVAGDVDTYTVSFGEGSHFCFPGSGQDYNALVTVAGAEGGVNLNYNLGSCDNTWKSLNSSAICLYWSGTCSSDDSRTYSFQVTGANSCQNYTFTWQYCSEGDTCPGC